MATLRTTLSLALFALAAPLVDAQAVNSLPACGQSCIDTMIQSGGSLGCPDNSLSCLCAVPNFGFGIRDCAIPACGEAEASTVTSAASALCATATLAPATTSTVAATTPISSTPAPASETTPPAAATSVSSVPPAAETTSTTPPAAASTSTAGTNGVNSQAAVQSPTPATSSGVAAATTSTASSSTRSGTSGSTATAENNNAASAASSSAAAASSTAAGATGFSTLPTGAKAGIGVGIGVGALAVIGVFVLIRRKGRKQQPIPTPGGIPASASRGDSTDSGSRYGGSVPGTVNKRGKNGKMLQISDPLSGSGRSYANDPHYAQYGGAMQHSPSGGMIGGGGMSELEQRSRRYEDMVPRASPRHMV